jgi:cold-inducible RNA-binding protein
MNNKLYVGNLSFDTSEAGLREAFEQFGQITDVYVASDRETGRPRGFAFVTFSNEQESAAAVEKMNGAQLDGRALNVTIARPKEEGGGGGGGSRSFGPNRKPGAFQQRYNSGGGGGGGGGRRY